MALEWCDWNWNALKQKKRFSYRAYRILLQYIPLHVWDVGVFYEDLWMSEQVLFMKKWNTSALRSSALCFDANCKYPNWDNRDLLGPLGSLHTDVSSSQCITVVSPGGCCVEGAIHCRLYEWRWQRQKVFSSSKLSSIDTSIHLYIYSLSWSQVC